MSKKRIIAFEGIDGVGKTSLIGKLKLILQEKNYKTLVVSLKNRDCYLVNYYDQKQILLENQYMKLSAYMFDLLYTINNLENDNNFEFILFDRYIDSINAYFGSLHIDIPWVNLCKKLIPDPYRTYVMDIPVEMALDRIRNRDEKVNNLENEIFLSKVREKYISIACEKDYKILDGKNEIKELCNFILKDLNI